MRLSRRLDFYDSQSLRSKKFNRVFNSFLFLFFHENGRHINFKQIHRIPDLARFEHVKNSGENHSGDSNDEAEMPVDFILVNAAIDFSAGGIGLTGWLVISLVTAVVLIAVIYALLTAKNRRKAITNIKKNGINRKQKAENAPA